MPPAEGIRHSFKGQACFMLGAAGGFHDREAGPRGAAYRIGRKGVETIGSTIRINKDRVSY